jgi:hypothetical protein
VAGGEDRAQPEAPHADHGVVLQQVVVGGQHPGVAGRDGDPVAGVPDGGHGLDVVPVAMGLEHRPDPEPGAEVEEALVLVGRVDEDGLAGGLVPQHEDVVLVRPDHDLVHLGLLVRPVQRVCAHDDLLDGRSSRR